MDVFVDYQGNWGFGDLLCSEPMLPGLVERFGPDTRIWLSGNCGDVRHSPLVRGIAQPGQRFDHVVAVKLFTHMPHEQYARLEALPSLVEHMCSYAGVTARGRRPRLHLREHEFALLQRVQLPPRRPRIAICADHSDPLRHWPVELWQAVARTLQGAGAEVIDISHRQRLGVGTDLTGQLTLREAAIVMTACDLFAGNNSGPFHYAQAAGLPCVVLNSVVKPERYVHRGATVYPVEAGGLPCLHCMTRCFAAMQQTGCIANPRGRCMTDIPVDQVLDAIDRALQATKARPALAATAAAAHALPIP